MVYQGYGNSPNLSSSASDQNRKIFLGGLNYHTTDDILRAFCCRFGKMTDCLVMRNAEGKSRGFGFVTYEDTSSVEDFMRSRPHTIDNRQIDPKRAMPREEQNSTEAHLTVKKLFVAGLREGINEESLRQYFSRYGNIMEVLVMKDRDGKPRGFAFVTFDDYDAVDKAVLEKPHIINGRNLDVKKAVPKEKMQEESGGNPSGMGGGGNTQGMPQFNRNNSSNYPGQNAAPPASNQSRNNYGQMRDNFNDANGSWDNQGTMSRMNNSNPSYNQPPTGPYGQQGGYNTNTSGFNTSMPSTSSYPQSFNQMGQNQPPPPPPPSQQSSMMNYDMYNNNSNMPYNVNPNQPSTSNYMPQNPSSSYGQNQQQGFGNNPNSFGNMNNPFNLPPPPPPPSSGNTGYNNTPSSSTPFDNSNSYGITSQNYGGGGNYNNMPQQQSRGGGPMRGGRGGGNNNNYGNPSSGESSYSNRPAPYPSRGGRGGGGGGRGGGRGRGRGQ